MHCSCCGSTSKIDHPSTCYQTQGNRCSCSSHQEDEETDEVSRPDSLNTRTKTWDHSIKQSNDTNFAQRTCACSQDIRDDHQPKNKNINDQVVDTFEYRVYGMDCTACAKTLEKSISRLPAIKEVNVNFNTAKMTVSATSAATIQLIETEVQKLGYRVEPMNQNDDVQTYVIQGMDCSSCAKRIENHFKTLSYVMDVSVNFSTGKMRIEHNSTVEEIIAEVKKIGYKATIDTPSSYRSEKNYRELVTVIVSGVFMGLGLMGSIIGFESKIPIACYAIAMVVSGYKPFKSAFYAIRSRSLDMNVLMTAAAIGAALIGEWLEGATVVWLFAIGNFLQVRSLERTRHSIRNLMDLAPPEAWVKVQADIVRKPVEEVMIGDIILVKPGEKIPLDGEIIEGESSINQAPITGESIPVDKTIGDRVYAGTINEHGTLSVKVTRNVSDSTLSKIIHMVEEAQEQKAPTENFVDQFARFYTPTVFLLAIVIMIFPPLFGVGIWQDWFYRGLELLVVACPCALVISTPVAIVSAIGNAARNGVLMKGGIFLEKAHSITTIAFDKTGTLTEGKPKVTDIKTFSGSKDELLSIALTLESFSTHPIAKAIVDDAIERGIASKPGEMFQTMVGKGVQAMIDETMYYAGNVSMFEEMAIPIADVITEVEALINQGKTVVLVGTKEKVIGVIAVSDRIRESTANTLTALKQNGVKQTVILTGDHEGAAKLIASEANIDHYYAELLPEDKVDVIKALQSEGQKVAMVGDGINDAPALATADIGIAMGGVGTDTAMETAGIVFMADHLEKLPYTMKLSRKTLGIIKQNIWFSIIVKLIALILIFPGWLTLWLAVLSDTGAALIVILNSIRLLRYKEKNE